MELASKICMIIPHVAWQACGIGTYARRLGDAYRGVTDDCFNILAYQSKQQNETPDPFIHAVFDAAQGSLRNCLERMAPDVVVVQYSGYGYDPDGAPTWLAHELEAWKMVDKRRAVIVMFHELWADVAPWRRTFWLIGKQRHCTLEFLRLATVAVTSNDRFLRLLQGAGSAKAIQVIPIGPTFSFGSDAEKRWDSLLVLGKDRSQALRMHKKLIVALVRSGVIKRLVLCGEQPLHSPDKAYDDVLSWNLNCEVLSAYNFALDNIPLVAQESGLVVTNAPSDLLPKSSVFLSSAMAGKVVFAKDTGAAGFGLEPGRHYLSYQEGNFENTILPVAASRPALESISSSASELVRRSMSWDVIASSWSALFQSMQTATGQTPVGR